MKLLIHPNNLLQTVIVLAMLFFCSCHKPGEDAGQVQTQNQLPVANAGSDIHIDISYCAAARSAELNGSGSFDPADKKLYYEWRQISGVPCVLSNNTSAKATATNFVAGDYGFELKVTNATGAMSKDTIVIRVTGIPAPVEVNINATFSSNFDFYDNYIDCDLNFFGCLSYDLTTAAGTFNQLPSGQFGFSMSEQADSAASGTYHDTYVSIYSINQPYQWVSGSCSVDFKQLIVQGGGTFTGTVTLSDGSATGCAQNIFTNLNPLTISGVVNTATHTINFNLQGKLYL